MIGQYFVFAFNANKLSVAFKVSRKGTMSCTIDTKFWKSILKYLNWQFEKFPASKINLGIHNCIEEIHFYKLRVTMFFLYRVAQNKWDKILWKDKMLGQFDSRPV